MTNMKMKSLSTFNPAICVLLMSFLISGSFAWESEEYEMFDLVEEVGQNFYEVLEVPQDVTAKDLKTAYRKLSLKLHPDKNPAPDAAEKFRQLVAIYEVLKDPNLRISYNQVLQNGLPNWRHPSFYFRRVRKLELWQVGLIVLTIVSVCQYFGKYASYWEKKLAFQEQIDSKLRRVQRSRKLAKDGLTEQQLRAEAEKFLTKPSIYDVAPFQIYRGIKYTIFGLPGDIKNYIKELKAKKERERIRIAKELEEERRVKELAEEVKNKPRKRKVVSIPQKEGDEENESAPGWGTKSEDTSRPKHASPPVVSGGLWTDDDISELVRLCSKLPGGTPERWEKIAAALCRPVPEVTFMAKKVLERLASKKTEEDETSHQPKVKVKTKGNAVENNVESSKVENWSAEEQKALESALLMYPKGSLERWDKIAKAVHGRSKEECMQRYKYLAEILRKSKEEKEKKQQEEEERINGVQEEEEAENEDEKEVEEEDDEQDEDDDEHNSESEEEGTTESGSES